MEWDRYFIGLAELVSQKSKDTSTKVGAVIVGPENNIVSTGYNDFPRGVKDTLLERRERPIKYRFTEHAERNAIYNAARHGIRLEGCRMYLNWEPYALCSDCTRAIIQSGIVAVIGPNRPFAAASVKKRHDWDNDFEISRVMLQESGVVVVTRPGKLVVDVSLEDDPAQPMEKCTTCESGACLSPHTSDGC
jgi:dCMP deaminase